MPGPVAWAQATCDEQGEKELPAQSLLDAFVAKPRPDRAALGYRSVLEIEPDGKRTLRVTHILDGGAAAKTDLAVGDGIVAMNGDPLPAWKNDLERVIRLDLSQRPGDRIALGVERDGIQKQIWIEAAPMSEAAQRDRILWVEIATERLSEGLGIYCTDPAVAAEYDRQMAERKRVGDAMWTAIAPYPRVRITYTRRADGELEMRTDPPIDLPDAFPKYHMEGREDQLEALKPGEELLITLVNPNYEGR